MVEIPQKNKKALLPAITELWLHHLWMKGDLKSADLFDAEGQPIEILFEGWYNKSWGPDFHEARIRVGGTECFGDIEIHLNQAGWYDHKHHTNPSYNRVVLHVFYRKSDQPALDQSGRMVPSICLEDALPTGFWKEFTPPDQLSLEQTPGACGLVLKPDRYVHLKNLVFRAAENRMLKKSERFLAQLEQTPNANAEEILYQSICRSLGYNAFKEQFELMARIFTYLEINELYTERYRESKTEVLGRWFGSLKILDRVAAEQVPDDLRREWRAMQQLWDTRKQDLPLDLSTPLEPYRPLNQPMRRLTGLYYHLEQTQFHGLLKSWLRFLWDCQDLLEKQRDCKKEILERLDSLFPQPQWDPLSHLIESGQKNKSSTQARLIGQQRQLIVMVNSILPFFLAWSRLQRNPDLEKTLFALFLILPPEGENRKTKFMEDRLFATHPDYNITKCLGYYQGLIQIHDDSCRSFYQGCRNCDLLKML